MWEPETDRGRNEERLFRASNFGPNASACQAAHADAQLCLMQSSVSRLLNRACSVASFPSRPRPTSQSRWFSSPSVYKPRISFASDNAAGIHPKILKAIEAVNVGHVTGYGDDPFTERARKTFGDTFGIAPSQVHFVANGTGANVLSLGAVSTWYNSVLVSEAAHIHTDEAGAPERMYGLKVVPLASGDGKINPEQIVRHTYRLGDIHHSQPRIVSITNPTEFGVVYSASEVESIAKTCSKHGLLLHLDGARIYNAAVSMGLSLKQATRDLGVDLMSFGGTKNGLMIGEAVLFFRPGLEKNFRHLQKQAMQLTSKHRFIAAQMEALLHDDLWKENARVANDLAFKLSVALKAFPKVHLTHPCQANCVFATMPREYIDYLQEEFYFYVWDEASLQVRLMTAFDTLPEHLDAFIARLRDAQSKFG